MSNFTNLNEIFHIFSKTPVADGQTLASARNKSGHTVTTSDVWAEDIPAFFWAPTQSYIDNFKTIAKDNDLCYDETNNYIFYFRDGEWTLRGELEDNELLANYEASKLGIYNDGSLKDESKAVVKYYKDRDGIAIVGNNNNTADGNGYTARIAKDESGKSFVPQFISSMDKIVDGNPSSYYEPVVNGGDITEDIADKGTTTKYIANNYAGIIQFHKQLNKTGDKLNGVTISAFEYIGKKLNDVIENLSNDDTSAFNYTVAESLPSPDASLKGWIYFVPSSKQENNNIYNEFICVDDKNGNWKWEQIGSTAITLPGTGDFIGIDENNNLYVKTSSVIEDNTETVPTTQLLYSHHVDNERHLTEDETSNTGVTGQSDKGTKCYGVILESNENILIDKIVISQVNYMNASIVTDCYIKITDPKTNIYYKSNKLTNVLFGITSAQFKDDTNPESVDNLPLLLKDRKYHVTFHSSIDDEPLELNVAFQEHEYNFNSHIGHHITNYIDERGIIRSCPKETVTITGGNSFTPYGYKVFFSTAKPTNKHIVKLSNEFVNLYNIWDKTKEINKHDFSHEYENKEGLTEFLGGQITGSISGTSGFASLFTERAVIADSLFKNTSLIRFNNNYNSDIWTGDEEHRNAFYYEFYQYSDRDTIFDNSLRNVINGTNAFYNTKLSKFNDDLSCLMNGRQMFMNCSKLRAFNSALPSLTNGIKMFSGCTLLLEFETKLPNLSIANEMFKNNTSLAKVNTCLPNITQGEGMFMGCSALSNVRFSKNSFQCLYNGCDMFNGCSKLGQFYYELPYLETADDMFLGCQLDVKSVRIIAESLYDFGEKGTNPEKPDYAEDDRKHVITIGIRQGDIDKVQTYVELIDSKGWVVEINEYQGDSPLPPSEDEPEPDPDNPGGSGGETPDTPDDPDPEQVSYNITEDNPNKENPYVSDISSWRKDRYEAYNLKITNIPYDGEENVGLMIGTVGENN